MTRPQTILLRSTLLGIVMMATACAPSAGQSLVPNGNRAPETVAAAPKPATRPASPALPVQSFEDWRQGFRPRALGSGISGDTYDRAFAKVSLNRRVLELDSSQPEFSRPIWKYLDGAVSANRIATGQANAAAKAAVLDRIQRQYGVDYPIVVAIWGLESAYGSNFGSIPVIESMATLAYQGRRRNFAEEQLVAALRILQAGDITPSRMVGSWAGAMGHTQFIPTSFLEYAVDFSGDGRRDLWASDATDALASTANYLSRFGWTLGAPAAVEATLPGSFDYLDATPGVTAAAAEWRRRGVRGRSGVLPDSEGVSILLPAGAKGPAFAVYPNFKVIKRYNNATSYALAVAHLADRISGGGPIAAPWPRGDRTLSRTEKQELQGLLTRLGFDTQGIDGIIGPNSRNAVRSFQSSNGLVPDGYVSGSLLQAVRRAAG
ncbi:MAG: lytic murein transglycosylase [Pseudomonadota bacterium]